MPVHIHGDPAIHPSIQHPSIHFSLGPYSDIDNPFIHKFDLRLGRSSAFHFLGHDSEHLKLHFHTPFASDPYFNPGSPLAIQ